MARPQETSLADAITAVRRHAGSHDKLVAILKDTYGLEQASRTLVINWEKGAVPSARYRDALTDLGVDGDLFNQSGGVPADVRAMMREALANQRKIEGLLQVLAAASESTASAVNANRRMLGVLQKELTEIRKAVEQLRSEDERRRRTG